MVRQYYFTVSLHLLSLLFERTCFYYKLESNKISQSLLRRIIQLLSQLSKLEGQLKVETLAHNRIKAAFRRPFVAAIYTI